PVDVLAREDRRFLLDRPAILRRRLLRCACHRLERLLAVLVVLATTAAATRRRCGAATAAPTPIGATAFDLVDLRSREAHRRRNVVGDDLDDRALLTLFGFPAALLEPAAHDDARPLGERRARVLRELAPRNDVEEARLLFPLLGLLVSPRAVHRDAETHLR